MDINRYKKLLRVEFVDFSKLSKKERLETLRISYYKVIREYHPDLNNNKESSEAMSKLINAAYDELCEFYSDRYDPNKSTYESESNFYNNYSGNNQTDYDRYSNSEGSDDKFWKKFFGKTRDFFEDVGDKIEDFHDFIRDNLGKIILITAAVGIPAGLGYLRFIYDAGPDMIPNDVEFDDEMEIDAKTERLTEKYYSLLLENVDLSQPVINKVNTLSVLEIDHNQKLKILEKMHIAMQKEFETKHVVYEFVDTEIELNKILNNWIETVNAKKSYAERVVPILKEEVFDLNKSIYQLIAAHLEEYYNMNIGMLKIGSLSDNLLLDRYSEYEYNFVSFLALIQSFKFDKVLYKTNIHKGYLSFNNLYNKENYIKLNSYIYKYLENEDVISGIRKSEESFFKYIRPDAYHQIKNLGVRRPVRDVEKSFYYEGLMDAIKIVYEMGIVNNFSGDIRTIDIENENFDYIFESKRGTFYSGYVKSLEEKQNQIDNLKKIGVMESQVQEGIAEILNQVNIDIIYHNKWLKEIKDNVYDYDFKGRKRGLDVAYEFIERNIYILDEKYVTNYGLKSVLDQINQMKERAERNSPTSSFQFTNKKVLQKRPANIDERKTKKESKKNDEMEM